MTAAKDAFIPIYRPSLGSGELRNVQEAVRSGWISSKGQFIVDFETRFSQYIGCRYGVATSNGTAALHLALASLGIGPGDEVIVPDLTFVAPVNAVLYVGARPVLVDIEPESWGIDPSAAEKAITPRTKGIILVHLYGNPAQSVEFLELCKARDLFLIEDAAEAHGATYGSRRVGSFGHVSCFSFYGNKILTTGEGGMCLTDDASVAERMGMLRDHGMRPERRYWHPVVGYNYRMTNLQAAVGVAQLGKIDIVLRKKMKIARQYAELLSGHIDVQQSPSWGQSVFWLYSVLAQDSTGRDELERFLGEHQVDSRPFFFPIHVMPPYVGFTRGVTFPLATKLAGNGLNLPSYPDLTHEEVDRVAALVLKGIRRH